jgi:hypothetical protein
MSRVHSRPLAGGAPLDRAILDSAASPTRVFFGILFLAWSWVSTVLILGRLLAPSVTSAPIPGIPTSYLIAFGFALLVTAAEFVSAGRWAGAYWSVLLLLDAPFTTWQTYDWLTAIIQPLTTITTAGGAGIGVVSLIGGIVAAIFGELLLFGKRRR